MNQVKRHLINFNLEVGGVRQVNKGARKSESEKTESKPVKATPEDLEEFGEDKKEKPSTTIISGAKTGKLENNYFSIFRPPPLSSGESEAFPKAAVQAFHEKPMPTHEKNLSQKPNIIQQPRKC